MIYKSFSYKSQKFYLKKFDNLNIKTNACFVKIDVEGIDHEVLQGMKNLIIKNKPVILIEYNYSNFRKIYNFIKKKYDCYRYDIDKNILIKLKIREINKLLKGNLLENKYIKNSVNLFYIPKEHGV